MPFYKDIPASEFERRIQEGYRRMETCDLCPRACGANRMQEKTGFCLAGKGVKISSAFPHHGEEPVLSGTNGSGTIFFSHCTLRCAFCQNYQISHEGNGDPATVEDLANEMLALQKRGCHNINLVTPTQYVPHIIHALSLAAPRGLSVPLVYNCSGYESLKTLALLDGIIDVYLPDIKYAQNSCAGKYSSCPDYVEHNRNALKEMWRQVGPLVTGADGVALQGLIIRHLVLPGGKAGTDESMRWLAMHIGPHVAVSLMAQYQPLHNAFCCPEINCRITREEYVEAVSALDNAGLSEGWIQDWEGIDGRFIIDFIRRKHEELK